MCEFKVFLDDKLILDDVIYAKVDGGELILRDILGVFSVQKGMRIVEVDVSSERMVIEKEAP